MNLSDRINRFVMTRRFVLIVAALFLASALDLAITGHWIAAGAAGYLSVMLAFLVFWHGLMAMNREREERHASPVSVRMADTGYSAPAGNMRDFRA